MRVGSCQRCWWQPCWLSRSCNCFDNIVLCSITFEQINKIKKYATIKFALNCNYDELEFCLAVQYNKAVTDKPELHLCGPLCLRELLYLNVWPFYTLRLLYHGAFYLCGVPDQGIRKSSALAPINHSYTHQQIHS